MKWWLWPCFGTSVQNRFSKCQTWLAFGELRAYQSLWYGENGKSTSSTRQEAARLDQPSTKTDAFKNIQHRYRANVVTGSLQNGKGGMNRVKKSEMEHIGVRLLFVSHFSSRDSGFDLKEEYKGYVIKNLWNNNL
jgi:hypothetical protein